MVGQEKILCGLWISDNLGPDLKYISDSSTHGTIQPTKPMTPEEYQKSLLILNLNGLYVMDKI